MLIQCKSFIAGQLIQIKEYLILLVYLGAINASVLGSQMFPQPK